MVKKVKKTINIIVSKYDPILGQRFETRTVEVEEFVEQTINSTTQYIPIIIGKQQSSPKPLIKRSGTREGRD